MNEKIEFKVKGSAAEPYLVTFVRPAPGQLHAYCSCPAGSNGQHCKHRTQILEGDDDAVAPDSRADAATVREWLAGSAAEKHLRALRAAEVEVERAKKALHTAQKDFGRSLRG